MLFSLRSSHCVAACAISAGVALFGAVPSALADPPPTAGAGMLGRRFRAGHR